MSNSPLVNYTKISPNRTSPRNHAIDTITIHCVVGQCSVETLGNIFTPSSRQASANYGIGPDGRIGMYVEECDRSWCSSNAANDHRAITIEVASDTTHPYAVKDAAYNSLIKLLVDICKRNNIKELKWKADKSLIGQPDKQNMTVHRWFDNKVCPGEYLYSRHSDIAAKVNAQLGVAEKVETTTTVKPAVIKKGDTVSLAQNARYYDGTDVPDWVVRKQWIVSEVSGDRAVINRSVDGLNAINSPVNVKYLTVTKTNTKTETKPNKVETTTQVKAPAIKKGDVVTLAQNARYYDGVDVPDWVVKKQWIVVEVSGDRAVINRSVDGQNAINSPINVKYLTVVKSETKTEASFLVQVDIPNLNIRKGPGTGYATIGQYTGKSVFTIVEVKMGSGSKAGWGKLKSGMGWISLDYTKRI